jgi:YD repeat-containing protein
VTSIGHGGGLWGNDMLQFKYNDKYGRLRSEAYPNGGHVDFSYDSANRLASVTDPFGNVSHYGYDSRDRLASIVHSTLGSAGVAYDSATDLPTRMTLPDGSWTAYDYDLLSRLVGFDVHGPDGTRALRHQWSYDALGRKSAAGIAVASALTGWSPSSFQFAYDPSSRVTLEKLMTNGGANEAWKMEYGYDMAGNRTELTDSARDLHRIIAYGAANREATVDDNSATAALQYDYKGNVTVRPPLDYSAAFHYNWDAQDRLVSASRYGNPNVNYKYDALGRLLWRGEGTATLATATSSPDVATTRTLYYWLGLSPLATEEIGSSGPRVKKIYMVIPGAAICGVLGSQTGALAHGDPATCAPGTAGAADRGVKRYFHYNDLGTVQVQTKVTTSGAASVEGAWEPDFFGNYDSRYAWPGSPSRPELGLTGKIFDNIAYLNHVFHRCFDIERGSFESQSPVVKLFEHEYTYSRNSVVDNYDTNGLLSANEEKNVFQQIVNARNAAAHAQTEYVMTSGFGGQAGVGILIIKPASKPFRGGCGNYADSMCGGKNGGGELINSFIGNVGELPEHVKIVRREYRLFWGAIHADCLLEFDDGSSAATGRNALTDASWNYTEDPSGLTPFWSSSVVNVTDCDSK